MYIQQVPQLTDEECRQMLSHSLSLEQRTLNSEQMEKAVAALQQCPIPLFLQLMINKLKNWKSFSKITDPIPTSIDGIISSLAMYIASYKMNAALSTISIII